MSARLASAMLVSALIKTVEGTGGNAMVLAKGDPMAGALLVLVADRGRIVALRERGLLSDGTPGWIETGPSERDDPEKLMAYIDRRRRSDPDLWVIEFDGVAVAALEAILAGA